jgi:hypothetical protein
MAGLSVESVVDPTRTLTMAGGVSVCCRHDSTKCVLAIFVEHRPASPEYVVSFLI